MQKLLFIFDAYRKAKACTIFSSVIKKSKKKLFRDRNEQLGINKSKIVRARMNREHHKLDLKKNLFVCDVGVGALKHDWR